MQKQGGNSGTPLGSVLGNNFAKRFDRLEISDLFKQLANGASSEDISANSRAAEMRKMLSKTETADSAEKISKGAAGYAYMEMVAVKEAVSSKFKLYQYDSYAEERAYYNGLLEESDGIAHSVKNKYGQVYENYEYICAEGAAVDREKASPLSTLQSLLRK